MKGVASADAPSDDARRTVVRCITTWVMYDVELRTCESYEESRSFVQNAREAQAHLRSLISWETVLGKTDEYLEMGKQRGAVPLVFIRR